MNNNERIFKPSSPNMADQHSPFLYKLEPHKLCFHFTQLRKKITQERKKRNREKREKKKKKILRGNQKEAGHLFNTFRYFYHPLSSVFTPQFKCKHIAYDLNIDYVAKKDVLREFLYRQAHEVNTRTLAIILIPQNTYDGCLN